MNNTTVTNRAKNVYKKTSGINSLDNGGSSHHHRSIVGGRVNVPPPPQLPQRAHQQHKPFINITGNRIVGGITKTNHGSGVTSSLQMGGMGGFDIPFAQDDTAGGSLRGKSKNRSSRSSSSNSNSNSRTWIIPFCLLMILVLVAFFVVLPRYEKVIIRKYSSEQDKIAREQELDLSMQYDTKIANLQKENVELTKRKADEKALKIKNQQLIDEKKRLEFQIKDTKNLHKDGGVHTKQLQSQIDNLTKQNNHLITYKKKMQDNIQLMSRTACIEKYGYGPHFVDVLVQFDSHLGKNDQGTITVQMAPVDEMPHAVYWFLEQVRRRLYDGNSFHRNAGHVVQAGPAPNFLSPPNPQLKQRFQDAGFHSTLFQEYSDKFPHEKYTLGYAGRPGGPDFYINVQDNSKIHGPGGQSNYPDPSEADICFAKVVNGFNVVDRIHKERVKPGDDYMAIESNVAIVSMKIQNFHDKEKVMK